MRAEPEAGGISAETQEQRDQFAKWIKRWLSREGMSQAQLARRAGLSVTTLSAYVTARNLPKADAVSRLAEGMGLPVEDVLVAAGFEVTPTGGSPNRLRLLALAERVPERDLDHAVRVLELFARGPAAGG